MQVGLMNHPAAPVTEELRRIAAAGYEFVDLTLEPPGGWPLDASAVRPTLAETSLGVVGHTAWYLPIASPFPELREPARAILREQFVAFAALGAEVVNVHPDPMNSMYPLDEVRRRNADAVELLAGDAKETGIRVMVENLGRSFSRVEDLAPIFDRVPEAGFHLDIGHANMLRAHGEPNRAVALIDAFGDRLCHVHVHDNVGGEDLHLPVGAGTIPWPDVVAALKRAHYDGTVTFEVFRVPDEYVDASRRLWLELWEAG